MPPQTLDFISIGAPPVHGHYCVACCYTFFVAAVRSRREQLAANRYFKTITNGPEVHGKAVQSRHCPATVSDMQSRPARPLIIREGCATRTGKAESQVRRPASGWMS